MLSRDSEEEGRGKHSCEDRSDTSTGGSKVTDSPCANNNCHPPSSLSNTGSSLGRRVHPLIGQAIEVAWHHSSSRRSLHVYWTSFCVGLDYGPRHPKGNCHYNGTTARQGHAHMATLSGAIMPPAPLYGFIFSPSSLKDEVKERPRLNCFERRSIAKS